jgi:hypothetical protein
MTVTTARDGDGTGTTTMTVIMNWLLSIINEDGGRLKQQMIFDNILEMTIRVVYFKIFLTCSQGTLYEKHSKQIVIHTIG